MLLAVRPCRSSRLWVPRSFGERGQRFKSGRQVAKLRVRVDAQCELRVRVSGKLLGRLHRDTTRHELRHERMPQGVEVGSPAAIVHRAQEGRALPGLPLRLVFRLFDPPPPGRSHVAMEHLRGLGRNREQRFARTLATTPGRHRFRKVRPHGLKRVSPVLRVRRAQSDGRRVELQCKVLSRQAG